MVTRQPLLPLDSSPVKLQNKTLSMRFPQSSHYPSILDGAARAEPTMTHPQEQVVQMYHPHEQSMTVSISVHRAKLLPRALVPRPAHR